MKIVLLIIIGTLLLPFAGKAGNETDSTSRCHWLIPDHTKLQFAGNIGFLSSGFGYSYSKDKAELDLIYGYVPKTFGGPLHSVTLKNTWIPFRPIDPGKGFSFDWFTVGIPVTYTFGSQFFFLAPKDQYPARYYDYSSALRLGLFVGGRANYEIQNNGYFNSVGMFYEFGTYDLLLHNYIFNIGTTRFVDIFNLALGVKVGFGK